jgi:hypothetical protein
VLDSDVVLFHQPLSDQQAVASLWVALDTDSAAVPIFCSAVTIGVRSAGRGPRGCIFDIFLCF